ncbi:MAG: PQQ-binding-like beta-propeller repeat protein [bacterium]|nr:PQQ-binding-like beta-propeller repeat protein [bacterium]
MLAVFNRFIERFIERFIGQFIGRVLRDPRKRQDMKQIALAALVCWVHGCASLERGPAEHSPPVALRWAHASGTDHDEHWTDVAVHQGSLFLLSHLGEGEGVCVRVDAATGKVVWRRKLPKEYVYGLAPQSGSEHVLLYAAGFDAYGEPPSLMALDSKDGRVRWRSDVKGNVRGVACVDGRLLCAVHVQEAKTVSLHLVCVSPRDGKTLWTREVFDRGTDTVIGHGGIVAANGRGICLFADMDRIPVLSPADGALFGVLSTENTWGVDLWRDCIVHVTPDKLRVLSLKPGLPAIREVRFGGTFAWVGDTSIFSKAEVRVCGDLAVVFGSRNLAAPHTFASDWPELDEYEPDLLAPLIVAVNVRTGRCVWRKELPVATGHRPVCLQMNAKRIICGFDSSGEVVAWEPLTGRPLWRRRLPVSSIIPQDRGDRRVVPWKTPYQMQQAAWAAAGDYIAACDDTGYRAFVIDAATGKRVFDSLLSEQREMNMRTGHDHDGKGVHGGMYTDYRLFAPIENRFISTKTGLYWVSRNHVFGLAAAPEKRADGSKSGTGGQ